MTIEEHIAAKLAELDSPHNESVIRFTEIMHLFDDIPWATLTQTQIDFIFETHQVSIIPKGVNSDIRIITSKWVSLDTRTFKCEYNISDWFYNVEIILPTVLSPEDFATVQYIDTLKIQATLNSWLWLHSNPVIGFPPEDFIAGETPIGDVDGLNLIFTLLNTPASGTVSVFLNGQLQTEGPDKDYTRDSSTVTFLVSPTVDDIIRVSYVKQ